MKRRGFFGVILGLGAAGVVEPKATPRKKPPERPLTARNFENCVIIAPHDGPDVINVDISNNQQ